MGFDNLNLAASGLKQVVVGISDCGFSSDTDAVLVTYALGSCVAVAAHDPVTRVSGLLHVMLPESSMDTAKAERTPYMFADTGVEKLLQKMAILGADKRRLLIRLAGGAQVMNDGGLFSIGKRNYLAVRRTLWKAGTLVQGEAVGGEVSRTVRLEVGTGRFWIREGGAGEREMPMKGVRLWDKIEPPAGETRWTSSSSTIRR